MAVLFNSKLTFFLVIFIHLTAYAISTDDQKSVEEESYGVRYADDCEVCKYVSIELEDRLKETGSTSEVLETGYTFDSEKKKTKYSKSELRFIETMESVCDRLLTYNIHKERKDSTRFARGTSQTFQTLHGLVDRGVKVDLGIPYELWNKPSAEITHLKTQCEKLLEKYEDTVESWYWKYQDTVPLAQYLCEQRALKGYDTKCLSEKLIEESSKDEL